MRNILVNIFISLILISFIPLILPRSALADTLFSDTFNGSGELHTYNNAYAQLTGYSPLDVVTDHVEATRGNSFYLYTRVSAYNQNNCTSLDFRGDGFVAVMLRTTNDLSQYDEIQVTSGNRWRYFQQKGEIASSSLTYNTNTTHNLKACVSGNIVKGFLDGILFTTQSDTTNIGGYSGFGLENQILYMDNFTIETAQTDLDVPLLKQTSNPWQSLEYDTAHLWNPVNPTINAWGCAMTSAVMILQYYGIYSIPGTNFEPLNPGTLNDWLKSQKDGYIGTGWINWLAISRLSKLAAEEGIVPSFDALEYTRTSGADTTQLTNDINNNMPDILEEPGHFIVAKGINGATFDINDPYYNRTTLNDGYNNNFLSLGRYIPSHTDLSYIMLTTDPNITLTVKDQQGDVVGSSFVQSPITNPIDGVSTNSPIKIYYLPKPDTGTYTITATNTTAPFQISSYLYDKNGNPKIQTLNGLSTASYTINFDKADYTNSTVTKVVTFESILQDINNAQNLNLIDNGLATSLTEMLKNAQKQIIKNPGAAKTLLSNGIKSLDAHQNQTKIISLETFILLKNDFVTLSNSF